MTAHLFRKRLGSLVPGDTLAEDLMRKISQGEWVRIEVKRPRNIGYHRKLFALLNLVFENQSRFASVDELLDAVKVYIGHCETMVLKDGTTVKRPKSISFASMDQTGFEKFYDQVIDVVAKEIIPGIEKLALKQEVEAFLV